MSPNPRSQLGASLASLEELDEEKAVERQSRMEEFRRRFKLHVETPEVSENPQHVLFIERTRRRHSDYPKTINEPLKNEKGAIQPMRHSLAVISNRNNALIKTSEPCAEESSADSPKEASRSQSNVSFPRLAAENNQKEFFRNPKRIETLAPNLGKSTEASFQEGAAKLSQQGIASTNPNKTKESNETQEQKETKEKATKTNKNVVLEPVEGVKRLTSIRKSGIRINGKVLMKPEPLKKEQLTQRLTRGLRVKFQNEKEQEDRKKKPRKTSLHVENLKSLNSGQKAKNFIIKKFSSDPSLPN